MRGPAADTVAASAVAVLVTLAIAIPVIRAPSTRVFGMDIVGRQHDPFTVMQQFAQPGPIRAYSQPVTDMTGAALARIAGPVAAYNWLVLISFPLAAAAAYLLARHLALSPSGATVAALAYAFAPFHLAHAAYHPHVAQTQWMPLYFLALWRCADAATAPAIGVLGAATAGVVLSNFYGGLIAAVLTPIALLAYWLAARRGTRPPRGLRATVAALAVLAAAGLAYAWDAAGPSLLRGGAFAFPRADLFRYSAKWWSYLVPPVAHPVLGSVARRIWEAAPVREGLLEQQVSLGWAIVALGVIAVVRWRARAAGSSVLAWVPVVSAVAAAALLCSLSPERTVGGVTFVRPSALLYHVAPMFRSYARFGVVVQLMAALLAGIGFDALRQTATARARAAALALVVLAAAEYAVSPLTLWRDVLPTRAHRWAMQQPHGVRVLDCTPPDNESASVPWLTRSRVTLLDGGTSDCTAPNFPATLAAEGYTHLLVRQGNRTGRAFFDRPAPPGLRRAARFRDAQVFAVTAPAPAIYTAAMARFWPREQDAERTWRWMGADAAWIVVNTADAPILATLDVELAAFDHPRTMDLAFDGHAIQTVVVSPERRSYETGPFLVAPGRHELTFHPREAATIAGTAGANGDPRLLSCALGDWAWTVRSVHP